MRNRILFVLVGLVATTIALIGITRAFYLTSLVQQAEADSLGRVTTVAARAVEERVRSGRPVDDAFLTGLAGPDEQITYRVGTGITDAGPEVSPADAFSATREVPGGGSLTLARPDASVDHNVSEAILPLAVLGLVLLAGASVASTVLARRLAQPFSELAQAAAVLGSGRFSEVRIPRYAVPEAENIGEALRVSAARLDQILRREREFAANASHQLRTPITAMRLQLEDLAQWPQTHPDVAAELTDALHELDRLNGAVGQYLDLARGRRRDLEAATDITQLSRDVVARHAPAARRAGRALVLDAAGPACTATQPDAVDQIVDVLVDNALVHGRGQVVVSVRHDRDQLVVRVADEGRRPDGTTLFRRGTSTGGSTGIGLAVATALAASIDGRVDLTPGSTTAFELQLPRHDLAPELTGTALSVRPTASRSVAAHP